MAAPSRSLQLPLLDLQAGRQLPPTSVAVIKAAEQLAMGDDRVVRPPACPPALVLALVLLLSPDWVAV